MFVPWPLVLSLAQPSCKCPILCALLSSHLVASDEVAVLKESSFLGEITEFSIWEVVMAALISTEVVVSLLFGLIPGSLLGGCMLNTDTVLPWVVLPLLVTLFGVSNDGVACFDIGLGCVVDVRGVVRGYFHQLPCFHQ